MDIKECYDAFGGNYEEAKARMMKDDIIKRFIIKFLSDGSFDQLNEALEEKKYEDAFRAAHTLKGVSLNFSFDRLSRSVGALTETLRNWESVPVDESVCEEQLKQVRVDYQEVVDAIRKFQES